MRHLAVGLFVALLVVGARAGHAHDSTAPSTHPQVVLKVASIESPLSPLGLELAGFRRHVEETTRGEVRVKLLLRGCLGDEATLVERTREGRVQAFAGSLAVLSRLLPELEVLRSPYLFRGTQHAERALDRGVRDALERALPRVGLRFAGWGPSAFRVWLTRGSHLRRPADTHDRRVAAARGPADAALYRALGMTPVAADPATRAGEALAKGAIDAIDVTLLDAAAAGHDRVATHVVTSHHALEPQIVVYSARWFEGLPEQIQRELEKLPSTLVEQARKAQHELEKRLLAHLRARKLEVVDPTNAERSAFLRVTRATRRELAEAAGPAGASLLQATGQR